MVKLWLMSSVGFGVFTGLLIGGGNSAQFLASIGVGICFWMLMLLPMLNAGKGGRGI